MKPEDYFVKYLTLGKKDIAWGLHVITTGFTKIPPSTPYPPFKHPDDHNFTWKVGRVLSEYQVIYITRGKGICEFEGKPPITIHEGTIILVYPGVWHRYRPEPETGWDEYWIGFNGKYAQHLMGKEFFSSQQPVLSIGQDENLLKLFQQVFENVKEENIGFQQVISATAVQILADIYVATKRKGFEGNSFEKIIKKVKCRLMENLQGEVDLKVLAEEMNVSYSWLRKTFKYFTGISPHQYLLQLRIQKSRHLLAATSKSVKEVALLTGFESQYYFSRIFKQKTGMNPSDFRSQGKGR